LENERRAKKYQEEIEKIEAAENAKRAAAAKLFDPAVVLADAKRVHVFKDEVLGEVRYGVLSKREIDRLNAEIPEADKRAYKMIFTMLQKGYPDLKLADVEDWPYEVVARLSELLSKRFTSFLLQTPKASPNG
jgi:hypothetical protein